VPTVDCAPGLLKLFSEKLCVCLLVCTYVCLYVCMFIFPRPREQSFRSQKQPVYKKRLVSFGLRQVANMCRFEIRVERVCKDIVKAFPKRFYRHKPAEKQHSWPPRLSGKTNSFE